MSGRHTTHIEKYGEMMKEIKLRVNVINALSVGTANSLYVPTTIESMGLQFRKCFELIAFGSLIANQKEYGDVYADFAKHWEAAKLIKNLRRINPDFYPCPVIETPSTQPGVILAHKKRKGDFLTEEELVEAHGRCGSLMHSQNPFGKTTDYQAYVKKFRAWLPRMMNLLNNHEVRFVGDPGMWVIHMREHGHDEVAWYRFDPPATPS